MNPTGQGYEAPGPMPVGAVADRDRVGGYELSSTLAQPSHLVNHSRSSASPEALERINASLPAAWNAISHFAVPRALAPSGSADWYFELSVESTRIHASRLAGRVGVGHGAVNCCCVQSAKLVQATSGKRLRKSSMLTW